MSFVSDLISSNYLYRSAANVLLDILPSSGSLLRGISENNDEYDRRELPQVAARRESHRNEPRIGIPAHIRGDRGGLAHLVRL